MRIVYMMALAFFLSVAVTPSALGQNRDNPTLGQSVTVPAHPKLPFEYKTTPIEGTNWLILESRDAWTGEIESHEVRIVNTEEGGVFGIGCSEVRGNLEPTLFVKSPKFVFWEKDDFALARWKIGDGDVVTDDTWTFFEDSGQTYGPWARPLIDALYEDADLMFAREKEPGAIARFRFEHFDIAYTKISDLCGW